MHEVMEIELTFVQAHLQYFPVYDSDVTKHLWHHIQIFLPAQISRYALSVQILLNQATLKFYDRHAIYIGIVFSSPHLQ